MNEKLNDCWAVLFDLDGTLIDTDIDFGLMNRSVRELAQKYGIDGSSITSTDALGIVDEVSALLERTNGLTAATAYRAEADHVLHDIEAKYCASPTRIEGASELLHSLKRSGVRIGVVTRNSHEVAAHLLRVGDLEHDVLLARNDVNKTKPDPSHLLAALEILADGAVVPTDRRSAMVGDHWMDIKAGHAAGLFTIGLLRGRPGSFFKSAAPDMLVDSVGDLLALVAPDTTVEPGADV